MFRLTLTVNKNSDKLLLEIAGVFFMKMFKIKELVNGGDKAKLLS